MTISCVTVTHSVGPISTPVRSASSSNPLITRISCASGAKGTDSIAAVSEPPHDPEVIDVRPDEQLPLERLEPWLRAHLPAADGACTVRQFGGGHANLTYLVRFGEREYVLRRPPLGPIAPTAHDMTREHRVLARLHAGFPLAPRSHALCTDPAVIGARFPFHGPSARLRHPA